MSQKFLKFIVILTINAYESQNILQIQKKLVTHLERIEESQEKRNLNGDQLELLMLSF